jgi:hypothetical protein
MNKMELFFLILLFQFCVVAKMTIIHKGNKFKHLFMLLAAYYNLQKCGDLWCFFFETW